VAARASKPSSWIKEAHLGRALVAAAEAAAAHPAVAVAAEADAAHPAVAADEVDAVHPALEAVGSPPAVAAEGVPPDAAEVAGAARRGNATKSSSLFIVHVGRFGLG
jgi:hypothetical protein